MTAVLGFFQGELNRKQLWHDEKKNADSTVRYRIPMKIMH